MPQSPQRQEVLRHATAGMEFAATFGLLLTAGVLLDRHLDTLPGWTMLGGVLGYASGVYHLVRRGLQMQHEWEARRAATREARTSKAVVWRGRGGGVRSMALPLGPLLAWTVPVSVLTLAAGLWPMWLWMGTGGLTAGVAAWLVVLPVMLLNGLVTRRMARRGASTAAFVFVVSGMLRALVCLALAAVVWWAVRPPAVGLAIWLVAIYLPVLAGEGIWVVGALHRDAQLVESGCEEVAATPTTDGEGR